MGLRDHCSLPVWDAADHAGPVLQFASVSSSPEGDVTVNDLAEVIQSLQATIRRDHATVGANETRTRNTLIDPLLRALGWADSSVVTHEYLIRYGRRPSDYGVVDYALHEPDDRGHPIALIEAKRMNEELNEDHRDQALDYAFDRMDSVQYLGLTNGDRWELYEVFEDRYRPVFSLSIRDESALHCAATFLSSFPTLTPPEREESPDRSTHLQPVVRDAAAVPIEPEILYPISVGTTRKVDIPKLLTWFAVTLIVGAIAGYIVGFQAAEPVGGTFAKIGLVVIAIAVIAVAVWARSLLWSSLRGLLNILRLEKSYGPTDPERQKSLLWLAAAVIVGVLGGGALGYFVGTSTAQPVMDFLAGVGKIVVYTLIAAAIALLLWGLLVSAARSPRKRSRGRGAGYSSRGGGRSSRSSYGWGRKPRRRG